MRLQSLCVPMLVVTTLVVALTGCGSSDDETVTSNSSAATSGAITVAQLVARSADSPIAVRGMLHIDQTATRLCGGVLESFPPQCGEPWVELVGLDLSAVAGTTTAEGVTWKEGAVLNLQRVDDGRFTVVGVLDDE